VWPYSGRGRSALVAAIAAEQLADRALAVTGVPPALANPLFAEARAQACLDGPAASGGRQRRNSMTRLTLPTPASVATPCKRELARSARRCVPPADRVVDGVNPMIS